jgi:hypothetical protein
MTNRKEEYLGDGLYAHDDGYHIVLSAPRENGPDYVALEPEVLQNFFQYLERTRGLEITVKRKEENNG